MAPFEDFIQALQEKASWKNPKRNKEEHLCFALMGKNESSYELEFFPLNESYFIMQVKLCSLPSDEYEKNEMVKSYAKRQVAVCKNRPSVLTVDNNHLVLYKKENSKDIQASLEAVSSFLKDVDWWLMSSESTASPFAFSGQWMK